MKTCGACLASGMSEEGECFWCESTQEGLDYLSSRGIDPADIYFFMGRHSKQIPLKLNDAMKIAQVYKNHDDNPH